MFDMLGWSDQGLYGIATAQSARALSQEEIAAHQAQYARLWIQAKPDYAAAAMCLQQYRPPVTVPAWYEGWSKAMAAEPLCNP